MTISLVPDTAAIYPKANPDQEWKGILGAGFVNLRNASGVEVGTLANPFQVTGSFTANIEGDYQDDTVFVQNTDRGLIVGGYVDDTAPDTVSEGNFGAFRITPNRAVHANLRDASGGQLLGQAAMAASIPVVIASDQSPILPGFGATNLGKREDDAHVSQDVGVAIWAVRQDTASAFTGASGDYSPIRVDNINNLCTSQRGPLGQPTFFNSVAGFDIPSMFLIDPITLGIPAVTNSSFQVTGDAVHDAVDSGNPIKVGGYAGGPTPPTAVSAVGDRVRAYFDLNGRFMVDHNREADWKTVTATASGNTTIYTPTSGKKIRLRAFKMVNNGGVTNAAGLRFASGGTIMFLGDLANDGGSSHMNLIGACFAGATDEAIIVNLLAAGSITVSVAIEEYT